MSMQSTQIWVWREGQTDPIDGFDVEATDGSIRTPAAPTAGAGTGATAATGTGATAAPNSGATVDLNMWLDPASSDDFKDRD